MPKFKKVEYIIPNVEGKLEKFVADISINSDGLFYCGVDPHVANVIDTELVKRQNAPDKNGKIRIQAKEFEALDRAINKAAELLYAPIVEEFPVIRYKITVSASVAADVEGNIYPNASWPNAQWLTREIFGSCGPGQPQSLSVAACAMMKKISHYPDGKTKIDYTVYYAGGDHHGKSNPAELLNSWNKVTLHNDAKEIPYSDENALFFHRLLMGITQLIYMVQKATFEEKNLLETIKKSHGNLLPNLAILESTEQKTAEKE